MRILSIDDKKTGCYLYRTKLPLQELKEKGHVITIEKGYGSFIDLKKYDMIILNRTLNGNYKDVFETAKKNGLKVVYDCDDVLDIIPNYSPASAIDVSSYFYMLRNADVITTTERLKEYFSTITKKPIHVLENCVNIKDWNKLKIPHKKLRIGYAGSQTHIKDILVLLRAIILLQDEYDFDFYILGFTDSHDTIEEWVDDYIAMRGNEKTFIGALKEYRYYTKQIKNLTFLKSVPIEVYPLYLSYLSFDIGCCPLEDIEFNSMKSCIKFYEYSMSDTPCIASNVSPYKEEAFYLADNNVEDWYNKLKKLIEDKELRNQLAEKQKEWVIKNRDIRLLTNKREQIYANS